MSTTQNQTLQNQLLEIEKEVEEFKHKHPRFFKLDSTLSNLETISGWLGYFITTIIVFSFIYPNVENFDFSDFICVILLALYPGFISVFTFQFLLEKHIERLIYRLHKPKISREQFDELRKLNSDLLNKKRGIQKQIKQKREQELESQLSDLRHKVANRKISFEEANSLYQHLKDENIAINSSGYPYETNYWLQYLFKELNEVLINYKNLPLTTNKNKPEQQVTETVQPVNTNQEPVTTVEVKPLSKQTTYSNNKTSHTQKSVVAPINNTAHKTSVVKSPEPTIISGIVEKLKKTQQRIKSVRIPAISPKKSVPTTRRIPGEKKSTSTGNVKTATEPITEISNKTTTTSLSGNTDNVTPVRTKLPVVPEEKTITDLFGEQPETESKSQVESKQLKVSVKTDYLKLNAHRHIIGERGEEFVLELEKSKLATRGFETLSEQVVHVSKRDDSKGYDILSFFEDGKEKYLEVKTTTEDYNAPFYLSESELVAMKKSNNYFIYRVYNFDIDTGKGKYFIMDCKRDLDKYYLFQPVSYRVSPKF